jgi:hypothetical protein
MAATGFLVSFNALLIKTVDARGSQIIFFALTTALLLIPFLVSHIRDYGWHEFKVDLDRNVRFQEIELGAVGRQQLAASREAYLLFDLQSRSATLSDLEIAVNGKSIQEQSLRPTMPKFGAVTHVGGVRRESFRQWWALRLSPDLLTAERLRVEFRWTGDPSKSPVLYGDLPSFVNRGMYHGPSFGHKTAVSMYKLRYDGEYRLAEKEKLDSVRTQSFQNGKKLFGTFRIRAITPTVNLGGVRWATPSIPSGTQRKLVFLARAGIEGDAELSACGESLDFDLQTGKRGVWTKRDLVLSAKPRQDTVEYELLLPDNCTTEGEPLVIEVRYLANMKPAQRAAHRFFEPLPAPNLEGGALQGFQKVLEVEAFRHWKVEKVF